MSSQLADLATRYSILPAYEGIDGALHHPPDATLRHLLEAFGVAARTDAQIAESLVSAPKPPALELRAPKGVSCNLPDWLEVGRAWGIAIQLYQLRSARNWGIGDFADLAAFARLAGDQGADFVGLNPLHALFGANPSHCSPFSPSNRRFFNPLYITVDAVPGYRITDIDSAQLEAVRAAELVDYSAVSTLKLGALREIWRRGKFDRGELDAFVDQEGELLLRHAEFEAVSSHMVAQGFAAGWHGWPQEWQSAAGAKVRSFAEANVDAVRFQLWLQLLCRRQLKAAQTAAHEAGMRIGLYFDFAVGEAPDGSSTWSDPSITVRGVRVGAPPDYFNATGQDWGLAPLSHLGLAAQDAEPFRALIDQAARGAGALRIDHVMALWQLFLIPEGLTPAEGTYVRYPIERMIAALAAASGANDTVIIGEDLGNVPGGFREVMDAANILSYRILFFERTEAGFIPPEKYPRNALVCLSTHDLPTFEGWWRGEDIDLRARYGLIGDAEAVVQSRMRVVERAQLLEDLATTGLLPQHTTSSEKPTPELVVATHLLLARTPSRLLAARLEDLVGEREPVNLPSTVDEYPNWRRKLAVPLEDLHSHPLLRDVTAALREDRPRPA